MNKVFYCIPTYKEFNKVSDFLELMLIVKYEHLELIIINANPGDNTSKKIAEFKKKLAFNIIEIAGESDEYWSATLNRGLSYIKENMKENDWIIISNIDISFEFDIISDLVKKASIKQNCQIGALSISESHVISSGVIMKSWLITKTYHPLAGLNIKDIPYHQDIEVDYLPGRCFIFPAEQLLKIGLIDYKHLPHYHADYEFSNRLKENGCIPFIDSDIRIYVDMKNTGLSIYNNPKGLTERIRNLRSIKNPSNPWYRINFVIRVFPKIFIPTGIFLYLARTVLETVVPGKIITRLFGSQNKGYSGVNKD